MTDLHVQYHPQNQTKRALGGDSMREHKSSAPQLRAAEAEREAGYVYVASAMRERR